MYNAQARMLASTGCLRSSRQMLLAEVRALSLLYGAQILADALQLQENKKRLHSVQRLIVTRVIVGMMPVDIAAGEAKRMFIAKQIETDFPH